jgi:hypothetical protein
MKLGKTYLMIKLTMRINYLIISEIFICKFSIAVFLKRDAMKKHPLLLG